MKLVTVAEMLAIVKAADGNGLSFAEMMEHAGSGLADVTLVNVNWSLSPSL